MKKNIKVVMERGTLFDGWFHYDRTIETPHGKVYLEEATRFRDYLSKIDYSKKFSWTASKAAKIKGL